MENVILNGAAHGDVATRLLAMGMDPLALKLWVEGDYGRQQVYCNKRQADGSLTPQLVLNATAQLRKDEWIELDSAVLQAAQQRMNLVGDLIDRNLVYRIENGLGTTILQTQAQSDLGPAGLSVTGLEETTNERLQFDLTNLPLPIIHKDLNLHLRMLEASRTGGQPLDTLNAQSAGRVVMERAEQMLVGETETFSFGGGQIYGYTTHPSRLTATLSDWATADGVDIVAEVLAMIGQMETDARAYGPYVLYVSQNFGLPLEADYSTIVPCDGTIRERILKINKVDDVVTSDFLPDNTAILVNMTSDTVRMVIGMDPQTLQWETNGGFLLKMKVMTIMVPQFLPDFYNRLGVVHGVYTP